MPIKTVRLQITAKEWLRLEKFLVGPPYDFGRPVLLMNLPRPWSLGVEGTTAVRADFWTAEGVCEAELLAWVRDRLADTRPGRPHV